MDEKTPVAKMVSLHTTPLYGLCEKPITDHEKEKESGYFSEFRKEEIFKAKWKVKLKFHRVESTSKISKGHNFINVSK